MIGVAFIVVFALLGLNIWAIVDVARRSDQSFKAIKQEKTLWLVLVLLAGLPAAIAYLAAIRPKLEGAPPQLALPGWYPDPAAPGYLRYHDGQGWTAAVAPMLPPAQPPHAAHAYPQAPGHPQPYYAGPPAPYPATSPPYGGAPPPPASWPPPDPNRHDR